MGKNVSQKLIGSHLVEDRMEAGQEIGLKIDQTLTQDATGTMVMLELEAMSLSRVKTELSAQYVDHNLLQTDFKNPDDHLFLRSACKKFGIWYSRPGNGMSHPVHMERFGVPGKTSSSVRWRAPPPLAQGCRCRARSYGFRISHFLGLFSTAFLAHCGPAKQDDS